MPGPSVKHTFMKCKICSQLINHMDLTTHANFHRSQGDLPAKPPDKVRHASHSTSLANKKQTNTSSPHTANMSSANTQPPQTCVSADDSGISHAIPQPIKPPSSSTTNSASPSSSSSKSATAPGVLEHRTPSTPTRLATPDILNQIEHLFIGEKALTPRRDRLFCCQLCHSSSTLLSLEMYCQHLSHPTHMKNVFLWLVSTEAKTVIKYQVLVSKLKASKKAIGLFCEFCRKASFNTNDLSSHRTHLASDKHRGLVENVKKKFQSAISSMQVPRTKSPSLHQQKPSPSISTVSQQIARTNTPTKPQSCNNVQQVVESRSHLKPAQPQKIKPVKSDAASGNIVSARTSTSSQPPVVQSSKDNLATNNDASKNISSRLVRKDQQGKSQPSPTQSKTSGSIVQSESTVRSQTLASEAYPSRSSPSSSICGEELPSQSLPKSTSTSTSTDTSESSRTTPSIPSQKSSISTTKHSESDNSSKSAPTSTETTKKVEPSSKALTSTKVNTPQTKSSIQPQKIHTNEAKTIQTGNSLRDTPASSSKPDSSILAPPALTTHAPRQTMDTAESQARRGYRSPSWSPDRQPLSPDPADQPTGLNSGAVLEINELVEEDLVLPDYEEYAANEPPPVPEKPASESPVEDLLNRPASQLSTKETSPGGSSVSSKHKHSKHKHKTKSKKRSRSPSRRKSESDSRRKRSGSPKESTKKRRSRSPKELHRSQSSVSRRSRSPRETAKSHDRRNSERDRNSDRDRNSERDRNMRPRDRDMDSRAHDPVSRDPTRGVSDYDRGRIRTSHGQERIPMRGQEPLFDRAPQRGLPAQEQNQRHREYDNRQPSRQDYNRRSPAREHYISRPRDAQPPGAELRRRSRSPKRRETGELRSDSYDQSESMRSRGGRGGISDQIYAHRPRSPAAHSSREKDRHRKLRPRPLSPWSIDSLTFLVEKKWTAYYEKYYCSGARDDILCLMFQQEYLQAYKGFFQEDPHFDLSYPQLMKPEVLRTALTERIDRGSPGPDRNDPLTYKPPPAVVARNTPPPTAYDTIEPGELVDDDRRREIRRLKWERRLQEPKEPMPTRRAPTPPVKQYQEPRVEIEPKLDIQVRPSTSSMASQPTSPASASEIHSFAKLKALIREKLKIPTKDASGQVTVDPPPIDSIEVPDLVKQALQAINKPKHDGMEYPSTSAQDGEFVFKTPYLGFVHNVLSGILKMTGLQDDVDSPNALPSVRFDLHQEQRRMHESMITPEGHLLIRMARMALANLPRLDSKFGASHTEVVAILKNLDRDVLQLIADTPMLKQ